MKREFGPTWSAEQLVEAENIRRSWEDFFASSKGGEGAISLGDNDVNAAQVRARHEAELMRYPNVVGVAEGVRTRKGRVTGERCLVVYVEHKVPRTNLQKGEVLPQQIDDVPVDVVEVGRIEPQVG